MMHYTSKAYKATYNKGTYIYARILFNIENVLTKRRRSMRTIIDKHIDALNKCALINTCI